MHLIDRQISLWVWERKLRARVSEWLIKIFIKIKINKFKEKKKKIECKWERPLAMYRRQKAEGRGRIEWKHIGRETPHCLSTRWIPWSLLLTCLTPYSFYYIFTPISFLLCSLLPFWIITNYKEIMWRRFNT